MLDIASLDRDDALSGFRDRFLLPDGVIYLDGNSLGPLPRGVQERVDDVLSKQWRDSLIRGWNLHDWMDMPERIGNRLARLIGAGRDTVTLADTLSLNVVKALSAAIQLNPDRSVILSDRGNFPSDLYMAQGLIRSLEQDLRLKVVDPQSVEKSIDEQVAVLMLTEVDYRTGRRHDMKHLTRLAHDKAVITVWDLAHSAGAFAVELEDAKADFAVGCSYKYLNAGPGAPGFIYVRPDHVDRVWPLLSGWLGHASPFEFDLDYQPGPGIRRMRVGTPPVLALAALDAALDIWDEVDMQALREKSMALGDLFIAEVENRCSGFGVRLASPRNASVRGSQVSFQHPDGYAVVQALISQGVIGDFRAPDIMRFGFAPLYIRYTDVVHAAAIMEDIFRTQAWNRPEFQCKAQVT